MGVDRSDRLLCKLSQVLFGPSRVSHSFGSIHSPRPARALGSTACKNDTQSFLLARRLFARPHYARRLITTKVVGAQVTFGSKKEQQSRRRLFPFLIFCFFFIPFPPLLLLYHLLLSHNILLRRKYNLLLLARKE